LQFFIQKSAFNFKHRFRITGGLRVLKSLHCPTDTKVIRDMPLVFLTVNSQRLSSGINGRYAVCYSSI
jgi:hypothetical protein